MSFESSLRLMESGSFSLERYALEEEAERYGQRAVMERKRFRAVQAARCLMRQIGIEVFQRSIVKEGSGRSAITLTRVQKRIISKPTRIESRESPRPLDLPAGFVRIWEQQSWGVSSMSKGGAVCLQPCKENEAWEEPTGCLTVVSTQPNVDLGFTDTFYDNLVQIAKDGDYRLPVIS